MLPSDKCHVLLRMYLCYILDYCPISGNILCLFESPEMFIIVNWVYFDAATKTIKLPKQNCKYQLPTF